MSTIYEFSARTLNGQEVALSNYAGKVLLVVNTASKCGFTPQYQGLEALYRKYQARGFVVLGFPCNQFSGQEPDGPAAIARFCSQTSGVTFPMFEKSKVNGAGTHPLYRFLEGKRREFWGLGQWNFTKFLIDRNGGVAGRFAPMVAPTALEREIE